MLTRQDLADILMGVNVAELARRSGIAEKTIYRLRHKKNAPSLDTVDVLLRAVDEMKTANQQAAA